MLKNKKVAIFGGTFNPPHIGHIAMVEALAECDFIDTVLVIPSNVPPHKIGHFASKEHRLKMCQDVFGNLPKVEISELELNLRGKSYTLNTLKALKEKSVENPFLVIGADSLIDFDKWYRYEEILKLCELLVYKRGGADEKLFIDTKEKLEKLGGKVSILDVCPPDVSSTGIRNLNLYGMPIDGLVASATEKYIKENSLYVFNGYMEPQFFDKCIKFREKYENLVTLLKERLTEKRFYHTLCVAKEAVRLAEKYGADAEKVFLAGLLHDICKDMSGKSQLQLFKEFGIILDSVVLGAPKLWHSYLGAEYIKNVLDINDTEIINAVRYHTTARANMSLTEKIIYLADFTSEERTYDGVEDMRKAVDISIEKAMYDALLFSVEDLKEKGATVHPDTLAAYNEAKSIYLK